MRRARFVICDLPVALALVLVLCAFRPNVASAKDLPSDLCALLGPQQLQKTLGQPFGPAQKMPAPPAYMGQPAGTSCNFAGKSGGQNVTFIVYVDRSPAEAKQTFEKLSAWYPATSKPSGIGDSAYIDKNHAIHVLKGSVRFFVSVASGVAGATLDKQTQELATAVAAQL